MYKESSIYTKRFINSFLLKNSYDVIFHDESMNIHEDDIINKFDSANRLFLAGHTAIGLNIPLKHKAYLNFEANIPAAILSEYSSGLVKPNAGGGFRLLVQIPF